MVCCGGHFVGKELPRLFYLQSRCLQPGMDHADERCEPTSDAHSYTSVALTDSADPSVSNSANTSDSNSNPADWRLCA